MTLCSVENLFIKKRSELPSEILEKLRETREKSRRKLYLDKIINLQIDEALIELGNKSPESDNYVTDSGSECSESDFCIEHEYNKL